MSATDLAHDEDGVYLGTLQDTLQFLEKSAVKQGINVFSILLSWIGQFTKIKILNRKIN